MPVTVQPAVRSEQRLVDLDGLKVVRGCRGHVRASQRFRDVLFRLPIAGMTEPASGQLVAREHRHVLLKLGRRDLLNRPLNRGREQPRGGRRRPDVSRQTSATVTNRGNIGPIECSVYAREAGSLSARR